MYLLAHTTTFIECPRELAFRYAANLENFAEWFPGVIRVAAANDLPFDARGKQYRETVAVPLRGQRPVSLQVVDVAAPARIVTEGSLPTLLPRMEIVFREAGPGRCEVDWQMHSRSTSGLARWTLLPLARHLMTQRARAAMQRLKTRLESPRARVA
jgi:hypothetical protein